MNIDFKDESGLWLKRYRVNNKSILTYSGARWSEMERRCKAGGTYQTKHPTYKGVENGFKYFQEFAEWFTAQKGYEERWDLDKDLLLRGNKVYSKTTCILLPRELNNLILKNDARRGRLPIGVSEVIGGWYMAKCSNGLSGEDKKQLVLGYYKTPEEAFLSYKEYKESLIKFKAEKWKSEIDVRAYNALMSYEVLSTD